MAKPNPKRRENKGHFDAIVGNPMKYPADPNYYAGYQRGLRDLPAAMKRVDKIVQKLRPGFERTQRRIAEAEQRKASTMRPKLERELARIRAALPKGMTFMDWYHYPVESRFVGSARRRHEAQEAWDYLQGVGDGYGLTVAELFDAEGVDYGPYE